MKQYIRESYDYFDINYNVAIESAIDIMKEKIGKIIDKIKKLLVKLINWMKDIFKKKINDMENKIQTNNPPQIQRQFAKDSFGAIFKSKEFLEKPIRSFIKIMDIESHPDGVESKVDTHIQIVELKIHDIDNIISKEYNSTDYITLNISVLKELYSTFEKFIVQIKNNITDFSNDRDLYSNHVTTLDEKAKSDLLLYYNLSISCLNSNLKLIIQNQKLINHIFSSLE